jgi:hypothetical protein
MAEGKTGFEHGKGRGEDREIMLGRQVLHRAWGVLSFTRRMPRAPTMSAVRTVCSCEGSHEDEVIVLGHKYVAHEVSRQDVAQGAPGKSEERFTAWAGRLFHDFEKGHEAPF